VRDRFPEELDSLGCQLGLPQEYTGNIPAGPRETLNMAPCERIVVYSYDDDRYRCRGVLGCSE
jgi:hypothetical protein